MELFVVLILFVAFVAKMLFDEYQDLKTHVEVFFVMMDDPNCCNSYNDMRRATRCDSEYCKLKLLAKIVKRIDSAQNSIDIAMYTFSNQQLIKSILNARRRGVKVRIIMDKSTILEKSENDSQKLIEAGILKFLSIFLLFHIISKFSSHHKGIEVKVAGEEKKLMHNKFCLIDKTSFDGVVISGSSNWTHNVRIFIYLKFF